MENLDFAGNKRVLNQLGDLMDSGHFPHALIIEGEQGLGKRTLAKLLVCALVCRKESKPCMNCPQCHKVMQGIHPDIFEHSAQGGANSFHVDVVRDVISNAYLQPNEADYKVYILGNADCMNTSAQNALLKVLEEPPEYVIFILTVSAKSKMLETVLSRSIVVSLEGVDTDEAVNYVSSHFENTDLKLFRSNIETFNGNIGKALNAMQEGRISELTKVCADMCSALVNDNEYALLTACSAFQKDRQSIIFAMEFLKNIFRDALVCNKNENMLSGRPEIISMLKNKLTRQKIIDLISICDKLKDMALMNSNNSLLITKICYSLRETVGR